MHDDEDPVQESAEVEIETILRPTFAATGDREPPELAQSTKDVINVEGIDKPTAKANEIVDRTRAWMALALVLLLMLEVAAALILPLFISASAATLLVEVFNTALTPTVALVGAATAFYYATNDRHR